MDNFDNQLTVSSDSTQSITLNYRDKVPAIIAGAGDDAVKRFVEFFAAQIRNPNTREAYARAAGEFLNWCQENGIVELIDIEPFHVAAWVEFKMREMAAPSVKQKLAGLRKLFDWLVVGQVLRFNPTASVTSPKHSYRKGKTPILSADETRELLDSIDTDKLIGMRDRALIAAMTYGFVRISAALAMKVKDVYQKRNRLWIRLHEKGGVEHEIPCHHNLETYLLDYIEAAGIGDEPNTPLFRSITKGGLVKVSAPNRTNTWAMINRRVKAIGITTPGICNHTFRGTGITAYLENPGAKLEHAQQIAAHANSKTTQLYDRRDEEISLDEVERIGI